MTGQAPESSLQKLVRNVGLLLVLCVGIRIAADIIQPVILLLVVLFIVATILGMIIQGPRFRR